MLVSEIFLSIQGESSYAGLPCVFVRLSGCNLSCEWCDTAYARVEEGSRELSVDEVMAEVKGLRCTLAEITGGEPLMQADSKALARRLLDEGYRVLIETNGSVSLEGLPPEVVKVVDVKCPSSGQGGSFLLDNIEHITAADEIKFVIGDRADYEFATRFVSELVRDRTDKILFAPVRPALDPKELADWMLKDCSKARLQLQLHSYIWKGERGR
jgi:7-carboxy-7-deazaguanine synthase